MLIFGGVIPGLHYRFVQTRKVKVWSLSSATVHLPDKVVVRCLIIHVENPISRPSPLRSGFSIYEVKVFESLDYRKGILLQAGVGENIDNIGTEQFSGFANDWWPISRRGPQA